MRKKIIILLALGMLICSLFNLKITNNITTSNTQKPLQFWLKRTDTQDVVVYYTGTCKDTTDDDSILHIHQSGLLHNTPGPMTNPSKDFTKIFVPKDDYIVFESKLWPDDGGASDPNWWPVNFYNIESLYNDHNYKITAPKNDNFMLGKDSAIDTLESRNIRYGAGYDTSSQEYYTYIQAEPWISSYQEWTSDKHTSLKVGYLDFYTYQAGLSIFKNTLAFKEEIISKP